MNFEKAYRAGQITVQLEVAPAPSDEKPAVGSHKWTQDTCPNCSYNGADVDPEGILWCPACGYSKKGCYT